MEWWLEALILGSQSHNLPSLSHDFLIYKMGVIIIVQTS